MKTTKEERSRWRGLIEQGNDLVIGNLLDGEVEGTMSGPMLRLLGDADRGEELEARIAELEGQLAKAKLMLLMGSVVRRMEVMLRGSLLGRAWEWVEGRFE